MPRHQARGFGRYLAVRTAPPRHLRPPPPVPLRPVLQACLALSLVSLVLIGARITQEEVHRPAAVRLPKVPPQVVAAPSPYTPKWAGARAQPQHSKDRPPVLLGTPTAAALTLYCADAAGPLSAAVLAGDSWACLPFLGTPRPLAMTAACRFLYGPDAWARQLDIADPQSWRCYRAGS